ncbi:MAG: preprotein translocase subunit YajC [Candidatus Omnitrophica bacterium]|nr:preprotein translocase subunit YajC [Candidatus Omnitrophota bacterium]
MPADQAASNPLMHMIIPYALIFLIFYFLLIKPQKDKQKELKDMLSNLKKNDEVVTTSGIHGTVVQVKDKTVVLRVDDNTKIEFDREAVVVVLNKAKE